MPSFSQGYYTIHAPLLKLPQISSSTSFLVEDDGIDLLVHWEKRIVYKRFHIPGSEPLFSSFVLKWLSCGKFPCLWDPLSLDSTCNWLCSHLLSASSHCLFFLSWDSIHYHDMHPFKACNSIVLNILTKLNKHYYCRISKCFHHPQRNPVSVTAFLPPPVPGNHGTFPVAPNLSYVCPVAARLLVFMAFMELGRRRWE